jgi:hypothetical protein
MPRNDSTLQHGFAAALLAVLPLALAGARPAAAQVVCDPDHPAAPYVFILLDTSGSLSWSPACSQLQLDAGECSFLCPTGDCFVPLNGDDPASKLYQVKEVLHTVLAGTTGVQLGFATFNQDQLSVRAKHWLYQATSGGPSIPGWGPYPAVGAQEVFGLTWACDSGGNDNEIGCYAAKPADLTDAWELARVRRLPKGGTPFNQAVVFWVRQAPSIYKITYTPVAGSTLGSPTVNVTVRLDKCNNPTACTSFTTLGQTVTSWSRVAELISWDNSSTANTLRTNPELNYFTGIASDASASNTCAGWDPNTDTAADAVSGYNLRYLTDTSDSRGADFYKGDVVPLDWLDDHNLDLQARLAPNPGVVPTFGVAAYFRDSRQGAETFLRLKNDNERPLIAIGSTPLANSINSFKTWYTSWQSQASVSDPDFFCRRQALVILSDGDDTCVGGANACTLVGSLYQSFGLRSYAVGFGGFSSTPGSSLFCIASEGGTGTPTYPQTKQELMDALNATFAASKAP